MDRVAHMHVGEAAKASRERGQLGHEGQAAVHSMEKQLWSYDDA